MRGFANRPILGKKEKIFLTGHTGFKGTWLTLLLEEMGHEVVGYSLNPTPNSLFERLNRGNSIQEFISDIRDVDNLKKAMVISQPSMVIHMAAQPLVLESYRKPRETFEINAQGTANVLEAAFSTKSVNVIGAVTTDKVYKNIETDYAYIETDALEGSSDPYSASKVSAEAVISAWRKIASISGGPRIATLRSGNVVGGGDFSENRIIPDLVRSYISKVPVQIRNPQSTRPWMHVLDSLVGYLQALQKVSEKQSHETFNFAPREKSLSVKEILEIALEEWPGMFNAEFLHISAQTNEAEFLNLNSDKAIMELGWNLAWNQESAVQSSIHWWKMYFQRQSDPKQLCLQEIEKVLLNE